MSTNGNAPSHYDAIVFGSGAGGLTCATTLQKHGMRTMLAEKNPFYGGYAHGFGKDGFYWDHGGHIFLAYRLGKQAREVFQRLKLDERVEMVPDQHDYRCIFPDQSMELPAEMSAAADLMAERFPAERAGIEKVFLTMERMIDEVDLLVPAPSAPEFLDRLRVGLGVPGDRVAFTAEDLAGAYTAGPIAALEAATRSGRLAEARNVLLLAAGAGITVTLALYRQTPQA